MPNIDHHQVPEVSWRPGYRKWDVAGREGEHTHYLEGARPASVKP
jgi:hypothetical protein